MTPFDAGVQPLATRRPAHAPAEPSRAEAEESAQGFEAIFLRMMIRDMRQTSDAFGEGLFGKDSGSQIKEGWFDTMLAERVSATGRVGLAEALLKDWERMGRIPPPPPGSTSEPVTLSIEQGLHDLPKDGSDRIALRTLR